MNSNDFFLHIAVPGSSSKWEEVQSKAKSLLLNTFGMYKCTIQLQSYRQEVNRTCANCQNSSPWFYVSWGLLPYLYAVADLRAINANLSEKMEPWQLCPYQSPVSQNNHSSLMMRVSVNGKMRLHDFQMKMFLKNCLQNEM
jgi:hypothetical protein